MTKHIAIIGAGVVGLACATQLQLRGYKVSVIDPRDPGEYCSFGNAGCLSRASFVPLGLPGSWKKVPRWLMDPNGPFTIPLQYSLQVFPWLWRLHLATSLKKINEIADALYPLVDTSIAKWLPLADRAGVRELIVQKGYAFAYESATGFAADSLGREIRTSRGVKIEVITGPEIQEFDPVLSPHLTHLVYLPEQGHCPSPIRLSRALADTLKINGAKFHNFEVKAFSFSNDKVNKIIGDGNEITIDGVVICAGAYSHFLSAMLGSKLPLETERGYHTVFEAPQISLKVPTCSGEGKWFATPMEDGIRISGTVELAGLHAPPNYTRADNLGHAVKKLLPNIQGNSSKNWMGHRPSLPDSKPVIGRSPKFSNAFFAFGHGHVGLTAAAPTSEIIADLIDGAKPSMNIKPFTANRF